jgi:ketosteroid isomerase-like protein
MNARSPAEIHVLFQDAFNRGDVDALTSLYERNATLLVGRMQMTGRENIRATFHSLLADVAQITLTTRSVIESLEGLAVLHGECSVQRMTPAEPERQTQGLSTEVVRKQPDGSCFSSTILTQLNDSLASTNI